MNTRLLFYATAAACFVLTTVASAAAEPAAASVGRHALRDSGPGWMPRAQDLGATPSAAPVRFGVLLTMRDQAGAEATLQRIADPSSASYGNWLSNAEFNARYA